MTNAIVRMVNPIAKLLGSHTRISAYRTRGISNKIDAALAAPLDDTDIDDRILDIGKVNGWTDAKLGDAIRKSGRTTGYTEGQILQTDVTVQVEYDAGKIGVFTNQLMAGNMSAGGDSGSLVLNMGNEAIGLLFAGGPNTTVINPINYVIEGLSINF